MEALKTTTKKLLELIGLNDPSVEIDEAGRRIAIFINEGEWIRPHVPQLVAELERLLNLVAKRSGCAPIYVDVNGYRRERENLIVELAKAAARKALASKAEVELPAMNAYERRLIHVELAGRPDILTESVGERGSRRVIVKLTGL